MSGFISNGLGDRIDESLEEILLDELITIEGRWYIGIYYTSLSNFCIDLNILYKILLK